MKKLTAKQYLLQISKSEKLISNKIEELKALNLLATKTTKIIDDNIHIRGSSDKIGKVIPKIIDLENEINQEILKYIVLRSEVMKIIDSLEPSMMELLYKRYFQFKDWDTIAQEMNYTYRWVLGLHGKALYEFQKKL